MNSQKPSLPYLEMHLTDHCNLNCKGCAHFAPIAEEWFADPAEHEKDMKRLSLLIARIQTIRLMGGEPLLHPIISSFLFSTRENFPDATIRLVTNGILLPKMPNAFWTACKANNIIVEVTLYPPTENKKNELAAIAKEKRAEVWFHEKASFSQFINLKGDSNIPEGFQRCRARMTCPMLRHGKIYYCFLAATAETFNSRFGTRIPSTGFVSIYDLKLTGRTIEKILNSPSESCKYCSGGWASTPTYQWAVSKGKITEWTANGF